MTDIVERLWNYSCGNDHISWRSKTEREAADTISSLRDRMAAMTADGLRQEAENARLREALNLAANRLHRCAIEIIHEQTGRRYDWADWATEARAALQPPAGSPEPTAPAVQPPHAAGVGVSKEPSE